MSEAPLDPIRAARAHMRQAVVKRFYATSRSARSRRPASPDARRPGARTPGRNALSATSRALMLQVAAEWERQRATLDPADMPLTRLLNSAIDGVARTMAETRAEILRYAGSDLLCYRAEEPERWLSARPTRSTRRFAGRPRRSARGSGRCRRCPCSATARSIEALRRALEAFDDPAALAGLSAMTNLTGSALLALATAHGFLRRRKRGGPRMSTRTSERMLGRRRRSEGPARGAVARS